MKKSLTITFDSASQMLTSGEVIRGLEDMSIGMGLGKASISSQGNQISVSLESNDDKSFNEFCTTCWYMDDVTAIQKTINGTVQNVPCPG